MENKDIWNIEKAKNLKEKSDKNDFESRQKQVEFCQLKEKISNQNNRESELFDLKNALSKGLIDADLVVKLDSNDLLDSSNLDEIFDKIDEIDSIDNIDNYLPKYLRITKEEYNLAVNDWIQRLKTLTKLNTSLILLSDQISWDTFSNVSIFSWYLFLLDKNLTILQENTIDIRDNLQEIEDKKNPKKKLSLLQQIINFIKNLLK